MCSSYRFTIGLEEAITFMFLDFMLIYTLYYNSVHVHVYIFSCCVDEVAAEHIDADAIIHYGPSCLTRHL